MAETKLIFEILAMDKASSKFRDVGNEMGKTQGVMKSFATVGVAAFAVVGAAAVAFGVESLKAAAHSEAVGRVLETMMKNSGAFGTSADGIKKAAGEIETYTRNLANLTGVDDEILNSIITGWMAVPEYAGRGVKGLEGMVKVVADIAAGTGKDVQSIGMAFIKVAGDEETALSKLLRQGIVFTDSQKDMYKKILDTSGEIAAQDYLIQQLGTTYAGAAEAAANPFDVLSQNVKNLQEQVGIALVPALNKFVEKVKAFIEKHGPDLEKAFQHVGDFLMVVVDGFGKFADWWAENPDLFTSIASGLAIVTGAMWLLNIAMDANPVGLIILLLTGVVAAIGFAVTNMDRYATYFVGLWDYMRGGVLQAVEVIYNGVAGMVNGIVDGINQVIDVVNFLGGSFDRIDFKMASVDWGGAAIGLQGAREMSSTFLFGGTPAQTGGNGYSGVGARPFAQGGIVTSATYSLIGEAGPEAVIPLSRMNGLTGSPINVNVTVNAGAVADRDALSKSVTTAIVDGVKRGIVSRTELRRSLGLA